MTPNFAMNVEQASMDKYLISIIGPTAIGKTSLSIALAKHYHTEIISCDSRQFFKEMSIGTAAPTKEEQDAAPHHFIQHISIHDEYSVGDFERDAISKLDELFKIHDVVIMVGGSGLYVNAVLNGLDEFPDIDPEIRASLNKQHAEEGLIPLQAQLKELDPISYEKIAIDNPQRLIRALEVSIGSGKPYSSFLNKKKNSRNFIPINIGLTADRQIIYDRINQRVDLMMESGQKEEVKKLFKHRDLNALNTVGYKELFEHFEGTTSLEEAIASIKQNTRRFAKRQITWFKRTEGTKWFDYKTNIEDIIQFIDSKRKGTA